MALDYFDASINRVSAWVVGFRSWEKALLYALCQPNEKLKELQDTGDFTRLMVMQESCKDLPYCDIWTEYCSRCGVAANEDWYSDITVYEKSVLSTRR